MRVYYSDAGGSTSDGEDTNLAPSNRVVRAWTKTGDGEKLMGNRINVTGSYTETNVEKIEVEPNDDANKKVEATSRDDGFYIARGVELTDSDANTLEATVTDKAGNSTTYPVSPATHTAKLDRNLNVSYAYDAAGNITKKTQVVVYDVGGSTTYITRYFYDDANRLEYADYDWTTTEDVHYVYGPTGNRVEIRYGEITLNGEAFSSFTPTSGKARGFVCMSGVVLEEWSVTDGATGSHTDDSLDELVYRYVRNPATDLGGGIGSIAYQLDGAQGASDYRYYHYNHKGDVHALTDADTKMIACYEYDAWGAPVTLWTASGVENDFLFSTKQWDRTPTGPPDVGLIYFGARYLDPSLGRWTQLDPAGTVDGLNMYLYVRNFPVSFIDADGKEICYEPRILYCRCINNEPCPGGWCVIPLTSKIAQKEANKLNPRPCKTDTPNKMTLAKFYYPVGDVTIPLPFGGELKYSKCKVWVALQYRWTSGSASDLGYGPSDYTGDEDWSGGPTGSWYP